MRFHLPVQPNAGRASVMCVDQEMASAFCGVLSSKTMKHMNSHMDPINISKKRIYWPIIPAPIPVICHSIYHRFPA